MRGGTFLGGVTLQEAEHVTKRASASGNADACSANDMREGILPLKTVVVAMSKN